MSDENNYGMWAAFYTTLTGLMTLTATRIRTKLSKDDFREFRKEYREDIKEIRTDIKLLIERRAKSRED